MRFNRCLNITLAGGAAVALMTMHAIAAPSPRNPLSGQEHDTYVIQVQQQQGQVKTKTTPKTSGTTARSTNANRSANTNRSSNANRSNTTRTTTNRTTTKTTTQAKKTTTPTQQTVQKQQRDRIQKQTVEKQALQKQALQKAGSNQKMPTQTAIRRQAIQLQSATRNQVRGNFKPAVYQSKLNTTFQSRYKQTPVVGKIRLAPPNWKHNPYMLAGLKGYKSNYRPFWFRYGGRPWYRWYYTALVGGVTYWYWSNLTQEEVVEQKTVLTSYAGGDCGCETPPPAPPECDCDDDDCGEQQ